MSNRFPLTFIRPTLQTTDPLCANQSGSCGPAAQGHQTLTDFAGDRIVQAAPGLFAVRNAKWRWHRLIWDTGPHAKGWKSEHNRFLRSIAATCPPHGLTTQLSTWYP